MSPTDPSILDTVLSIDRTSTWTLESTTPLDGHIGHPQGLTVQEDNWLVTTVFPAERRGSVCVFDRSGRRVREVDVTDADRIHPGGVDASVSDPDVWVPVAEYRPRSTTNVLRLDARLDVVSRFTVDDHLGATCDLGDGTLLAVSWGSRSLYRLTHDGVVLYRRSNPSHVVDYQDLQLVAPGLVLATGVAQLTFDGTPTYIGGLAVLDTTDLLIVHEVPLTMTMPSGRSATYNGFHVDVSERRVTFNCLVDDTTASIGHWTLS